MSIEIAELTRLHTEHVVSLSRAYAEALTATGHDAVVIHSGSPKKRSLFDDQYWPLRPTPHFHHWLPLQTPHSALVIAPGKKPKLVWMNGVDFWEQPAAPETNHFWSAFEVVTVPSVEKVKAQLPTGAGVSFIGEDFEEAASWGFARESCNSPVLLRRLDRLRIKKTAYERLCLIEANRRAALGHAKVLAAFQSGAYSELELHLLYLEATSQDDPETPYKNIVALGEHAATLHHVGYGRKKTQAQSLLLDAGAKYQGYDSDITRTAVKGSGAAADVFRALLSGMEKLQLELCRRVKTGVAFERLHNQSHELLAPLLREVGLARGSDAELVDKGVTRKFLPHGLGHSLGLQTHDVGCRNTNPEARNPFLRNTTAIEPGQCFTIEPGCYFIDSLLDELKASPEGPLLDWNLIDALRPFGGVRIEDDLLVLETGVENTTRNVLRS